MIFSMGAITLRHPASSTGETVAVPFTSSALNWKPPFWYRGNAANALENLC
jgi:hypothetical protein